MKQDIVLFLKSYRKDVTCAYRLIESAVKYNKDNIPFIVSVPQEDIHLFTHIKGISVISDASYAGKYMTNEDANGFASGYINQEICKLAFYETGSGDNYYCLDSDSIFIRDFYKSDFLAFDGTPYIVLVQDKDLAAAPWYGRIGERWYDSWRSHVKRIYEHVGLNDPRLRTCSGFQIMNCRVLQSLRKDFMDAHGFSYLDLIKISPWEFSWYNAWFQKSKIIPELAIEPLFKIFHTKAQYEFARIEGHTVTDIAHGYIGIVMNSNWGRGTYKNPGAWQRWLYKRASK